MVKMVVRIHITFTLRAIFEAEKEAEEGAEPISMNVAMERLKKK